MIPRVLAGFGAVLLCWLALRRHRPVKHPLGGFKCSECGKAGESFEDFDLPGYVQPLRTEYSREHGGTVTRSDRAFMRGDRWARPEEER